MLEGKKLTPRIGWLLWWGVLAAWTVTLLIPDPEAACTAGLISRKPEAHNPDAFLVLPAEVGFWLAKACHVVVYGVLVAALIWLPAPAALRWGLVGFLAVHACGTEFLQQFVEGRSGSLRDVVLDQLGLGAGWGLTWRRRLEKNSVR